jgi:hypothetical protein
MQAPLSAQASTSPPACNLLSASQAANDLGGRVVQTAGDRSPTFCLYLRPGTRAHQTLVSLTVVAQTTNAVARTKRLIDAESNVRILDQPGVWHLTASRFLEGDKGGAVSAIKNSLLVLIAVRGVADPKAVALRTLGQVLRNISRN